MTEQASPKTWLDTIDTATLTPIVRQALDSDIAEIIDWKRQPVSGSGSRASQIFRFTGSVQEGDKTVSWSLILKVGLGEMHGGDAMGGTRERLAYQSGFLNNLPKGLVAPRCYGVVEYEDNVYWLWLEDIQETVKKWTLKDYGLVARHLGQFNGSYLAGAALPTKPWISRGWLRNFVAPNEVAITQLEKACEHPLVGQVYSPDVVKSFLRLWNERETVYSALDKLPQTLCHMDAFRNNLFIRHDKDGNQQTVAADWAFSGIGAIGEDLAPFIIASPGRDNTAWDQEQIDALQHIALNSYLEGLQDAGWIGDQQAIYFCFSAATALRYGLGVVDSVVTRLQDENSHPAMVELFGRSMEQLIHHFARFMRNILKFADEALLLLPHYR